MYLRHFSVICEIVGFFVLFVTACGLCFLLLWYAPLYATGQLIFTWHITIKKSMWFKQPWLPILWWLSAYKEALTNPVYGLQSDEITWQPYFKFTKRQPASERVF